MAFLPIKVKPVGDIQLENRENIEAGFGTELVARIADSMKFHTLSNAGQAFDSLSLENRESKLLTANEANEAYGLDGTLTFNNPVREKDAKDRAFRILQERDRAQFLAKESQSEGFAEKAGNLLISLGTLATDPANFIPFSRMARLYRLGSGARTATVSARILKNPIARGAIDGSVGNLVTQPFIAANHADLGLSYGPEDGLFDVTMGAVAGGVLSGFGDMFRRSGIKGKLKTKNTINKAIDDFEAAQTASNTQLSPDAKAALNSYVEARASLGQEPDPKVLQSIARLTSALEHQSQKNSTFYLNEMIMRSDFDRVDADFRIFLSENAKTSELIPNRIDFDFDTAFSKLAKGDIASLPVGLGKIVTKLAGPDGKIKVKELIETLGDEGALFKDKSTKAFIASNLGLKGLHGNSQLTARQAFSLFEEIDQLNRASKLKIDDVDDLFPKLTEFKNELKVSQSNANLSLSKFKSKIKKLKAVIDKEGLRGITLRDLDGLSEAVRKDVIDFIKIFQEANPTESQLAKALQGDTKAIKELHEQVKFNSEIKDGMSAKEAMDTIRQAVSSSMEDPLVSRKGALAGEIEVDQNLQASKSFIDEETNRYSEALDEVELKEAEAIVKKEATKDGFGAGVIEAVKCGIGS